MPQIGTKIVAETRRIYDFEFHFLITSYAAAGILKFLCSKTSDGKSENFHNRLSEMIGGP